MTTTLDLDFYFSDMGAPMSAAAETWTAASATSARRPASARIDTAGLSAGAPPFFDFDNDGWLDLFLATTGVCSALQRPRGRRSTCCSVPHANVLFRNRGYGNYVEVTPASWRARPDPSMGVAYADYDGDGFVDFVVGKFRCRLHAVPERRGWLGADNHWLTVRLEGRAPVNRDAIGARVFVTAGDGRTAHAGGEERLGPGRRQRHRAALPASAALATADVRVRWPDGTEAVFDGVAADRVWHLVYGHQGASR